MCPTWVLKSGKSEVQFFEDVLLSHVMFVLNHLSAFVSKIITESQFKTAESLSSPEPSHMHCSFLDHGAKWSCGVLLPKDELWFWGTPGTLWGVHHSEILWASFDFPSLAFSLPFICLHRLWLQWPFRNGIGGDSVRTNHGFIPVQPQLVSRAFKTELLWKCMDTSRGLQQRVDTGTILVLLLSHTDHTAAAFYWILLCSPSQEINLCMQHNWKKL